MSLNAASTIYFVHTGTEVRKNTLVFKRPCSATFNPANQNHI